MAQQYGVKAKKGLGQHFLADESIAQRIVEGLILPDKTGDESSGGKTPQLQVLEIGPGTGVLTKYMLQNPQIKLEVCEIDTESIEYLQKTYPQMLYLQSMGCVGQMVLFHRNMCHRLLMNRILRQ